MRLTCPHCTAVYEVPTDRLRPGRRIRCARCNATWAPELTLADLATAAPEPDADAAPPDPVPVQAPQPAGATALDRLAAAPAAPLTRSTGRLRAAWAASILLLLGSAAATYVWRGRVVSAWPPSARILGTALTEPEPAPDAQDHQPSNAEVPHGTASRAR